MELRRLIRDDRGQMTVELVCVMPVILVLVVIVCDLMVYLGDCARFDRLAPQAVLVHAASPGADEYGASTQAREIQGELSQAMEASGRCSVSVQVSGVLGATGGEGSLLSFIPRPQSYACTLSCTPWPLQNGVFGFSPAQLTHTRTYVVDPYRPGVLL